MVLATLAGTSQCETESPVLGGGRLSEKTTKADLLAELQGLRAEKDRLQSELHRVMDLDGASLPVSELRGQLQLLHAMMNSSLDCVLTIDSHGVVREFNKAAEKTFGYSRE
tara:strand:+ start:441 stop:773 length:333 start_codon:yes stop_codon:yes gene_type:complete